MINVSKSIKQEEGISIWVKNNFHGTLNYIMRFGKTRIIELVVDRTRKKHIDKRIILLVPTDIAYQNIKHIAKTYNIEAYTIYTLSNMLSKGFSLKGYLLIVDEIHRFLNDKNSALLKKLTFEYKLGLTGSKLSFTDKKVLRELEMPVIDIITEEEAIEKNWIADYSEYNVAVDITDSEKLKYKSLNDNITKISENFRGLYKKINDVFKRQIMTSDYELIQSCYSGLQLYDNNFHKTEYITPDKFRLILCTVMGYEKDIVITNEYTRMMQEFWHPDNVETLAKSYIKSVTARNNYLKHNVNKVNGVLQILKHYRRPTIVYNDSIDMIDQLYDNLNAKEVVKYHSAVESIYMYDDNGNVITYAGGQRKGEPKLFGKTTIKKLAIERMNTGKAMYLITGKSLNESVNLPSIECIICTAGDTNPTTYDQRTARGKTLDNNNVSKKCVIINLFIDDFFINDVFVKSRDKEKLSIRQNNVKNVIWLENIDDLFGVIKKYN